MNLKKLGKSNLQISQIGFGCMSLGDDHASNEKLLRAAIESGINFFDTADLYQRGFNEETVGRALKPFRDKVLIATKVGNQLRPDGRGWDWNPTKKYIIESVEKSLTRLQTDVIDLYQLHGGTIDDPIDESISAFEQLVQEGKIRFYGLSSIRPNVIREYVNRSNIVSVMMQYSLLDRRPEESCLQLLKDNNIGVLARGSLAGGLLLGKPVKQYLGYTTEQVAALARAVSELAENIRTPTEVALQFVLSHQAVTSAVVGVRGSEQLQKATVAGNAPTLTHEEIVRLTSVVPPLTYEEHR